MPSWQPLAPGCSGIAIYTFVPDPKDPNQIYLDIGEIVEIQEEFAGWYRGYLSHKRKVRGVFPVSYVQLKTKNSVVPPPLAGASVVQKPAASTNGSDPLVEEACEVLREWSALLRKHLRNAAYKEYKLVRADLQYLLTATSQLIAQNLSQDGLKKLRRDIINRIDQGNRMQGLDAVARNEDGIPLDDRNASIIELYRIHSDIAAKAEAEKPGTDKKEQLHHLYLDLKACIASLCGKEETAELYFSVYNYAEKVWLSEDYVVVLTHNGMPKDEDKIGKLRTLFVDFTNNNLRDKVYLVCKIVRYGRMNPADKEKVFQPFRRPFGCAVIEIGEVLMGRNKQLDAEYMMPIYVATNEENWPTLTDAIISNSGGVTTVSTAQGFAVSMRMFHGDVAVVTKENPTLLKDITVTQKMGFPDIILPGLVRNVLYLTLGTGDFLQGRKTSAKNIEVAVTVRGPNGDDLPGCISRGCGEDNLTEYESLIYYHNNNPKFLETIRLDVPIQMYDSAHIFIVFRHCSSNDPKDKSDKNFAFTFLPLVQPGEGTVVHDATHTLPLYNWEKKLVTNTAAYLHESDPKKMVLVKDTFTVKTMLCSTKLTQKSELLRLLRWKNSKPDQMASILKQFTFIGDVEIIKFVQDIFDALFAILDSDKNVNENLDGLVFSALIYIIEKITDKRFNNFRPVLDVYIDMHFSGAMAHRHLISAMRKILENASDSSTKDDLIKGMKAMEYIAKFIVQSRILQRNQDKRSQNAAIGEENFKQDLLSLFNAFYHFMSNCPAVLIGAQTLAMQNFPSIFKELVKVFEAKELAKVAKLFAESVKGKQKIITTTKLQMMQAFVRSVLFETEESRVILTSFIIQQLNHHFNMEDSENLGPCISILAEILGIMQKADKPEQGILTVANLLPRLLQAYTKLSQETDRTQLGELTVDILVLLSLLTSSSEAFDKFLADFARNRTLQPLLLQIMQTLASLLRDRSFPATWSTMNLVQCKVVLNVIRAIKPVIEENFMSGANFKVEVWTSFFSLIQRLLSAYPLQLETFSHSKEKSILRSYGDMRGEAATILKTSWDSLGAMQARFVPGIIGPFVELTMSPHKGIRSSALNMLFSVISKHYEQNKSFDAIEVECIDNMDTAIENNAVEDDYRQFFISGLREKINLSSDSQFKSSGLKFLDSINELLELRLNVRGLPEGAEYEDERTLGIFKLMKFVKRISREEAYTRYVHQLCDMHVKANNYTEAAFTLCLHADLLKWTDQDLPAGNGFPAQTMMARKEAITLRIIDYMEKAKNWEAAIDRCKDLATQYAEKLYDYKKLGALHARLAQFYQNICSGERFFSEYFRVGFYGKGFPVSLRNKQFVYRGDELERISAFCERIQDKHPAADLLKTNAPPGDEILNSNGQYIQVVKVDPEQDPSHPNLSQTRPEYVRKFFECNEVTRFSFSRPYKKQKTGNEFLDLWTQKTILVTELKFPSVLRRAEVVDTNIVELSPIENALVSMANKNRELASFEAKYSANRTANSNPFTMALNGVVDAPVNGGVAMYRTSFFTPDYVKANPQHKQLVEQLHQLIDEQVLIVDRCISLHEKIVADSMRPLHEKIIENFDKNFAEELARLLPDRVRAPTSAGLLSQSTTNLDNLSERATLPSSVGPNPLTSMSSTSAFNPAVAAAAAAAAASRERESYIAPSTPPIVRSASTASGTLPRSLSAGSISVQPLVPENPPPMRAPPSLPSNFPPPVNLPPTLPASLPPSLANLPPPPGAKPSQALSPSSDTPIPAPRNIPPPLAKPALPATPVLPAGPVPSLTPKPSSLPSPATGTPPPLPGSPPPATKPPMAGAVAMMPGGLPPTTLRKPVLPPPK